MARSTGAPQSERSKLQRSSWSSNAGNGARRARGAGVGTGTGGAGVADETFDESDGVADVEFDESDGEVDDEFDKSDSNRDCAGGDGGTGAGASPHRHVQSRPGLDMHTSCEMKCTSGAACLPNMKPPAAKTKAQKARAMPPMMK